MLIERRVEIVQRVEIAIAINGGEVDDELEDLAEACELKV